MFSRIIIKFKNILFFKLIIYLLLIGLLIWLIDYLKEEYNQSLISNKRALESLAEAGAKLHATIELKDQLIKILPLYDEMSKKLLQKNCSHLLEIVNNITSLATKHRLPEKIQVQLSNTYDKDNLAKSSKFKVQNYNILLSFRTTDIITLIKILNDIYTIIPGNSIVSMLQIDNNSSLSANMLDKLASGDNVDLIEVKLNILIREISYK